MTTPETTETIAANDIACHWEAATSLVQYFDEPISTQAECLNCGDDENTCECGEYEAHSSEYLGIEDAAQAAEIAGAFIKAYRASEDVAYADMPAYGSTTDWNSPWNTLNDLLRWKGLYKGTDLEVLTQARDFAKAWEDYTLANAEATEANATDVAVDRALLHASQDGTIS